MKNLWYTALAATLVAGCGAPSLPNISAPLRGIVRTQSAATLPGKLFVDGQLNGLMQPGKPGQIGLQLFDPKSGNLLTSFENTHEKLMHLILVSQDLSSFAHVHPDFDSKGNFALGLNQPTSDPDNLDASRAVPKAGKYLLFSEVKPVNLKQSETRATLVAAGQEVPVPVIPDTPSANGEIVKYFKADGTPGSDGDAYKITFTMMPMRGMLHLNYNIQALHQMGGVAHYMPVKDLENWLGMPGHAILIGQTGAVDQRVFRHMHAGHHSGHGGGNNGHGGGAGPDLMFMLSGNDVPPAGLYRVWGQCKRQGKVFTFPVTIKL